MNQRKTYTDPRLAFATEETEYTMDFRQRFDASSKALQVLHGHDLSGKVFLITGATGGIGKWLEWYDNAFIFVLCNPLQMAARSFP